MKEFMSVLSFGLVLFLVYLVTDQDGALQFLDKLLDVLVGDNR